MHSSIDIWKMVAGVAIFLLGMSFLEDGLKRLTVRPFKLFLKKHTSHKLKAVAGGAILTAVLQSSSVVNFMVLAFVGTGIIQLQNALAIILGANLGSTFTSWMLATAGFNFNIETFALPIAGVFGMIMMLNRKENRLKQWSKLLFGFGFLFVGLDYIKTGIEHVIQDIDLSLLNEQPAIIFLLAGVLITSLIQSSSATVAIVLSALHVNAIGLTSAMAIVLGAEIGTTLKLVLASVNGPADKKRVATGNLLFNISITVLAFIFLLPVNRFITETAGIQNSLIALIAFQSLINIAGILLFYPFLNLFSQLLQKRFINTGNDSLFINKALVTDTELALEAFEKETRNFIFHAISFITHALDIKKRIPDEVLYGNFARKTLLEKYDYIKHLHGEIHGFYMQLQAASASGTESERMEQLISSVRNWMYAAKNIRDALIDIEHLKNSSNDTKYNFYLLTKDKMEYFISEIIRLMEVQNRNSQFKDIARLHQYIQQGYTQSLQELYKGSMADHLSEVEISTLINFNREMYTAFKSLVFAMKDYLLTEKEAAYFDELPGFIR